MSLTPLAALALVSLPLAMHAAEDKKLPKKPDRPFTIIIMASPRPAPTTEAETKAQKETNDSLEDLKTHVRDKRRDWFTLVDDPTQAEILLEVKGRGYEANHGNVLEGRALILHLEAVKVIGQGGLDPNSWNFKVWREAAGDMAGRVQRFCQQTYDTITPARGKGVRPMAVAANDRGVDKLKANDYDGAIGDFDEAIRLSSAYALPHFNRGLALSLKSDWAGAESAYGAALGIDAGMQRAHFYRAEARRARGDDAGARTDLDEAVRLDAKHFDSRLARADVVTALGEPNTALADLDEALALDPKQRGRVLARRGLVFERLAEADKALADYDAAVASGYGDAALHFNRGRLLAARGDRVKACGAFGSAANLDPKDVDALLQRGICGIEYGRLDSALADFGECIRLKPDMALAYWNRAVCYTKQGKTKLAAADKAQALKLDPTLAKSK